MQAKLLSSSIEKRCDIMFHNTLMAPVLLLLDMVSYVKETDVQLDIGAAQVSVQWAELFKLYATLGWVIGTVVIGWLLYNIVKYRSRSGLKQLASTPKPGSQPPARGTVKAALILTVIVSSILFPLTAATLSTVDLIEHPPQREGLTFLRRSMS